jgi:hypothetical protein
MCREKRRLKRSKGRAEGGVRRRNRGQRRLKRSQGRATKGYEGR